MNGKYEKGIDRYIPEGVELSGTQQEYLKVAAGLYRLMDTVRMVDVARFMDKPTGTVCSAMEILSRKGVLETDAKGVITLLEKET